MNQELSLILKIIETWFWLPMPFILFLVFKNLYIWWRQEKWKCRVEYALLEIKVSKEILKPLKAMEQIFTNIWGLVYDPPGNLREKWIDGIHLISFSLEIVSIDGKIHFFIRVPKNIASAVKSSIHGQYPDIEISEVEDYTKQVPQNIPNKNWDIWSYDFQLVKEDVYPIRTYSKFFEANPDAKEEKRLDPMTSLLEGLAKFKKGEQLWFQIILKPFLVKTENDFLERGKKMVDKLVMRNSAPVKDKLIIQKAADILISGKPPESVPAEEKKIDFLPPEMKLTSGEREVVSSIEEKMSKHLFEASIRCSYIAKTDVFFKPRGAKIPFSFLSQFSTMNLNGFKPIGKTKTKIVYIMRGKRLFLRKKAIFKKYINRYTPFYPFPGGTFVLNSEELATIYHFPGRGVFPTSIIQRVESRKAEAPPGLPVE